MRIERKDRVQETVPRKDLRGKNTRTPGGNASILSHTEKSEVPVIFALPPPFPWSHLENPPHLYTQEGPRAPRMHVGH